MGSWVKEIEGQKEEKRGEDQIHARKHIRYMGRWGQRFAKADLPVKTQTAKLFVKNSSCFTRLKTKNKEPIFLKTKVSRLAVE